MSECRGGTRDRPAFRSCTRWVTATRTPWPSTDGHVPYVVVPYLDRMELAYAAADLALCRAGAITCAELAAVGLPAVYVPLPHGNGEQRLNAPPWSTRAAALLVDDADLTGAWVGRPCAFPDGRPAPGWPRWAQQPLRSAGATPTTASRR